MILDQHGKPMAAKDLDEAQTSDRASYGSLPKVFETVKRVTPATIANMFKSAEDGDLVAQHNFFAEMEEKDAHIYTELSKRKRAVQGLGWQVMPPEDAAAAEKKAAEAVQSMLLNLNDFEDLCYDLLDAIGHGFANVELAWQRIGDAWHISQFNARPHSWFTLDKDTRSVFLLKAQDGEPQPLRPFGWMSHVHKSKTGYVARAGLFRVLAWPYMFKHFAVGDWAEFLETYGLPVRVGKYPVGSTPEEKKTLFNAVMALGRNASATMPETMSVEFMTAAGNASKAHDPFLSMADWADKAISKAVLGGTLTTQADGKTSTNALGVVHNEVRAELVKSDAKQLQGTLTRDLIYPWLVLNGHNVEYHRCPRFVFDLVDTADVTVWADALGKLVDVGMDKIPVAWVHKELGVPMAAEGEAVLQRAVQKDVQNTPKSATQKAVHNALLKAAQGEAHPLDALADAQLPLVDVSALITPVLAAVHDGQSPDEVAQALLTAFPKMDTTELEAILARVFFVADLWARVNPVDGTGVDDGGA